MNTKNNLIRLSHLFTKTLREDPADAEVLSHKLLVRAGYIRQVGPGIFSWMPLGLRVLAKVEAIINEEMESIGAQRIHFPALIPREPYETTGRWDEYGNNIFRLHDRKNADYLLAPTHEEMFALIVKDMVNSYKDLPLALFQIQTKYRDEARPRAGLLRGREFIMKDAYSFDLDEDGLMESYQKQRGAYERIFTRLGLPFRIAKAMSGAMGGSASEEFLSPTAVGEDTFVEAPSGYAANVEAAEILAPADLDETAVAKLAQSDVINTPGAKSIEEVSKVVGSNPENMLKAVYITLIHPAGSSLGNKFGRVAGKNAEGAVDGTTREVIVVFVPGDREADLKRIEALFSPADIEQTTPEDLKAYPELVAGFVGPRANVDFIGSIGDEQKPVRMYFDTLINLGSSWVAGANVDDQHVKNLVAGRDFELPDWSRVGVAEVREGDEAADGSGALKISRGVEIGHIFALGDKYTKAFDIKVLDEKGKAVTPLMGSYGIGVTRALALLAQNNSDEKGLAWPESIAPAKIHVVVAAKDGEAFDVAEDVVRKLTSADVEIILDDREGVSPGVKFKDAELLGAPYILVFGRGLQEDKPIVEFKKRNGDDKQDLPLDGLVDAISTILG
jgi:prolyl-tRNA synthetase